MSKQKKKRNKRYTGKDAKDFSPQTIRVTAVKRSKTGQWWHEKKRSVIAISATIAVIAIILLLIFELVRLFFV